MKPVWSDGDALPKVLFDLKSMLGNGLTFRDNQNAAVITFDAQHGVETRVTNPLKCTPIAFYPHGAVSLTAIGGVSNNVARKIDSLPVLNLTRTDGFLGITVNFDLAHTTPYVALSATANQSIPNAAAPPYTAMAFDTVSLSVGSVATWAASLSTRVTVSEAGRYAINATVPFDTSDDGYRQAWISKNGSGVYGQALVPGGSYAFLNLSCVVSMTAGDYVQVIAYQNSGGSLNLNGGNGALSLNRLSSAESPYGRVTGLLVGG